MFYPQPLWLRFQGLSCVLSILTGGRTRIFLPPTPGVRFVRPGFAQRGPWMGSDGWEELYLEPDPRPALGVAEASSSVPSVWSDLRSEPGSHAGTRPAEEPQARPSVGALRRLARLREWAAETGGSYVLWRWREFVRRRSRLDFKRRCWAHLGAYLREVKTCGITVRPFPRYQLD